MLINQSNFENRCIFYVFVIILCMVCMNRYACHSTHVKVRGQLWIWSSPSIAMWVLGD